MARQHDSQLMGSVIFESVKMTPLKEWAFSKDYSNNLHKRGL